MAKNRTFTDPSISIFGPVFGLGVFTLSTAGDSYCPIYGILRQPIAKTGPKIAMEGCFSPIFLAN